MYDSYWIRGPRIPVVPVRTSGSDLLFFYFPPNFSEISLTTNGDRKGEIEDP